MILPWLNLSKSKRFASQSEKIPKGTFNEAEQQDLLSKEKKKPESEAAKRGRKPLPDTLVQLSANTRTLFKPVILDLYKSIYMVSPYSD